MTRKRDDVKEAIVEAAMKVFAKHGFRASVDLVAREAGVSKGLVFWHFRSKDELVIEVARRALPTDVIEGCVSKNLKGERLLECVGVNYLSKYGIKEMRALLINTFALANINDVIGSEVLRVCGKLLNTIASKVYGDSSKENIVKVRAFFGALLCYVLNPPEGLSQEGYLRTLLKLFKPSARADVHPH